MANFPLEVTRLGFSLLQAISPRMAGRLAFALFCRTPPSRPKGRKAVAAHAAGAATLAGAERFLLPLGARKRAHAYRLNGGAIGRRKRYLVTHGWGASSEYMADLIGMLSAGGAEVIALDFPGHGRSGGRFLHMGLAVRAIAAAQARFGAFDAVLGHSFGGAALMVSATGVLGDVAPVDGQKIVTIGSPSEMRWLFVEFGRAIGLRAEAQAVLEHQVQRVTGRRLDDFDVGRAVGGLARPVLVVHAEDDKEVSAAHARHYADAGETVRLFWANGFGHRRIVSAGPVLAEIAGFLAETDEATTGRGDADVISLAAVPTRRAAS